MIMNEIDNIEIRSTAVPDMERYDAQLKALILTAEGTLPGSRDFGLSPSILDQSPAQAANLLALELSEKVDRYIPEITVVDVSNRTDDKGIVKTELHIERRV